MGKVSFGNIEDMTDNMQIYFSQETLGEEMYALAKTLDLGDIIGLKGVTFRTQKGNNP
jgi:lysyl-tRNA synthetase class 2